MIANLRTGILLFAHGSPVEEANQGVRDVAAKVAAAGPYAYVRAAFLEDAAPDLPAAVGEAAGAGIERLIVIPYFLTMGLHMRRDLPQLVAAARQQHPSLEIAVGESLEGHHLMPSIILGRVQEALEATR
jgi:sirohydrochlorin ferrochelatase